MVDLSSLKVFDIMEPNNNPEQSGEAFDREQDLQRFIELTEGQFDDLELSDALSNFDETRQKTYETVQNVGEMILEDASQIDAELDQAQVEKITDLLDELQINFFHLSQQILIQDDSQAAKVTELANIIRADTTERFTMYYDVLVNYTGNTDNQPKPEIDYQTCEKLVTESLEFSDDPFMCSMLLSGKNKAIMTHDISSFLDHVYMLQDTDHEG